MTTIHKYAGTMREPMAGLVPQNDKGVGWAICSHEDEVARARALEVQEKDELPLFCYLDEQLASGLHRIFAWETAAGGKAISALRYIGQHQAMALALGDPPREAGLGAPTVGQSLGDATIISPEDGDSWCTSTAGPGGDGYQITQPTPPADVFNLITPNGVIPGGGPYYAQYKTGAQAQIWRFIGTPGAGQGYYQCQGVVINGVPGDPPGQPGQGGNTPPPPGGGQPGGGGTSTSSGMSGGAIAAIVAAAAALIAGGAYVATRKRRTA
jgi:hypothetical protein